MTRHYTIPLTISSALFMQNLDTTALSTALPSIAQSLGEAPVTLHLALTAYMLSVVLFLPMTSWATDRFGARAVFNASILLFTAGSALSGLATTFGELVGGRVMQGLGGAMLVPVARIILVRSVDRAELIRAMAVMGMPTVVGPAIGPVVGGFFASYLSWRWIFWINVPIGLVSFALVTLMIENIRDADVRRFDPWGALLASVGLSGALFGADAWASNSAPTGVAVTCLGVGLAAIVLCVRHSMRTEHGVLDLELFKIATFRASIYGGAFLRIGFGAVPFLLPLMLQEALGYAPLESGLITFTTAIGSLAMRTLTMLFVRSFGLVPVLKWNTLIVSLFTASYAFFTAGTPYVLMIGLLFVSGLFRALQITCINTIAYADLTNLQASQAATLIEMSRRLAQTMGVSLAAALLYQLADGSGHIPAWAFGADLLVIGAISVLAAPFLWKLPADAGADLSK